MSQTATKRTPKTPEQVRAEQKAHAEKEHAAIQAKLPPLPAQSTALVVPDSRSVAERILDDVAPAAMPPAIEFDGKAGKFELADNGTMVDPQRRFVAYCPEVRIEHTKFNGEGEPPTRIGGALFDPNFILPPRADLGDTGADKWPVNKMSGQQEDPWKLGFLLPLLDASTMEAFTFRTLSKTGRSAVSTLLRNYERARRLRPDELPIVQLRPSSYQSKKYGTVFVPSFPVVGSLSPGKPDTLAADMNDEIGF
jgi:hypothetical protein